MTVRRILGALLIALLAAALAHADDAYPTRPVRIIVAFPPGGGADLSGRLVGQKLSEALGQPVVVDNKPGANGILGAELVAKSPPDGYTILLIDRGAFGINPALYRELRYDPLKDFAFITIAAEADYVLVVNPAVPAKTFADLVALAKAKPGQINYASMGVGSMFQLDIERMKAHSHIDLTHVAYKGAGPAIAAVVAGESQVMVTSPAGVVAFIKDGKLRPLAVGSPERLPILPDVPTMAEVGGGKDTLVPTYFAFAAPAGTPQPVVMRLNAEIKRIVHLPDVTAKLAPAGLDPVGSTPQEFADEVKRDIERFGQLVKALDLHAE
jgi:tripartite-type tricarboxylate transporter receptor subunit TctC